MRFKNVTSAPSYIKRFGTVLPLRTTPEIKDLKNLLTELMSHKSFDIILDEEEIRLVNDLLKRAAQSKTRDTSKVKKELSTDKVEEARKKRYELKHAAWVNSIKTSREEAMFFEDRLPEEKGHVIDPKPLEGKPKSLADILNHNATLG